MQRRKMRQNKRRTLHNKVPETKRIDRHGVVIFKPHKTYLFTVNGIFCGFNPE